MAIEVDSDKKVREKYPGKVSIRGGLVIERQFRSKGDELE